MATYFENLKNTPEAPVLIWSRIKNKLNSKLTNSNEIFSLLSSLTLKTILCELREVSQIYIFHTLHFEAPVKVVLNFSCVPLDETSSERKKASSRCLHFDALFLCYRH